MYLNKKQLLTYEGTDVLRICVKRDLVQCQKRPTSVSKETSAVAKETNYSVKRDLLQCQKRPITCTRALTFGEFLKGTVVRFM